MKTVYVSKITQESFNQLLDLGYEVRIIQVANRATPYGKYEYNQCVRYEADYKRKSIVHPVATPCSACNMEKCNKHK